MPECATKFRGKREDLVTQAATSARAGSIWLQFWLLGLVGLSLLWAHSACAATELKGKAAPEWDALFQRESGWIGADGNYSIPLKGETTLWLFSDTFVGTVKDNRRVDTVMINNSAAVQHIGSSKPVEFFYRTTKDGAPASFVTPDDGRGYFWLFDAVMTS